MSVMGDRAAALVTKDRNGEQARMTAPAMEQRRNAASTTETPAQPEEMEATRNAGEGGSRYPVLRGGCWGKWRK